MGEGHARLPWSDLPGCWGARSRAVMQTLQLLLLEGGLEETKAGRTSDLNLPSKTPRGPG